LYFAKTGLTRQTQSAHVRQATGDDVPGIVATARYGLDGGTQSLSRSESVRRVGATHEAISAGANEATTRVQMSFPAHFPGLDKITDHQ